MIEDKTLFTEKISAGKRTYFLDVKENQQGAQIFKITESRKNNGEFVRFTIMVFQEDFDKLFEGLEKVKEFLKENPSKLPNRVFNTGESSSYKTNDKEEDLSF